MSQTLQVVLLSIMIFSLLYCFFFIIKEERYMKRTLAQKLLAARINHSKSPECKEIALICWNLFYLKIGLLGLTALIITIILF